MDIVLIKISCPKILPFTAFGMPITSTDDQGRMNSYPLMRVQAVNLGNDNVIATTDAVVPVSTEVDCRDCHALGEIAADTSVWPDLDFIASAAPCLPQARNVMIVMAA